MTTSDLDGTRLVPLEADGLGRPFSELRDTGLLWLINRVAFHPRGFALTLHTVRGDDGDTVTGWSLEGDGQEVWVFGDEVHEDEMLAKVREVLGV